MDYLVRLNAHEYVTLLMELNKSIAILEKMLKDPTCTPNEKDICQHHIDKLRDVQQKVRDAESYNEAP